MGVIIQGVSGGFYLKSTGNVKSEMLISWADRD